MTQTNTPLKRVPVSLKKSQIRKLYGNNQYAQDVIDYINSLCKQSNRSIKKQTVINSHIKKAFYKFGSPAQYVEVRKSDI